MKPICFVATVSAALNSFMRTHIEASSQSWAVSLCTHPFDAELLSDLNARFIPLRFERKISPWRDVCALARLFNLFRRERFDLVHSIMPKTGLLTMFAAWAARVPNRLHTFTGQVWATRKGWKRYALKQFDRLIVMFATRVLIDSPSQRDFLIQEGVLPERKAIVIGRGSICGVEPGKFHPDPEIRRMARKELNIADDDTVILFLGRLNRDKGIIDLAHAFAGIADKRPGTMLVLVGPEEDVTFFEVSNLNPQLIERFRRVSFTRTPERYMAMADIFCLPSYREGFGQVIIEAAACGIPTVASKIYGIVDAVADGETGLLFTAGNRSELASALLEMIDNPENRKRMGDAARTRTLELFSSGRISDELQALYRQLLEAE